MAFFSIFGRLTTIQITLHTLMHGKRVGKDTAGNVYYQAKPRRGTTRPRRWVVYSGKPEASAVMPEWHGWLHHQTDHVPVGINPYRKIWQKSHQPNLTGTTDAYAPPSCKGQTRAASTSDYQPWQPPQEKA